MQVGGYGIGIESLLECRDGDVPIETAGSKTDIENHATLAAVPHGRIDFPVLQHLLAMPRIAVRVNIALAEFVFEKRADVANLVEIAKIHHHREMGKVAGLHGVMD